LLVDLRHVHDRVRREEAMNGNTRKVIALVAWLLAASAAGAYDGIVHHGVVQALAQRAGFSPEDAALIADASQSLDDNEATTAVSVAKIVKEMRELREDFGVSPTALRQTYAGLKDLPHMRSGQIWHSLTRHRHIVEQSHLHRINRLLASADPRQQRLALVYLGEYVHFLADVYVHPLDPLFGHLFELDAPDRAENQPEVLRLAMQAVLQKLREGQQVRHSRQGGLTPFSWANNRPQLPAQAAPDDYVANLANVVVGNAWSPGRLQTLDRAWTGLKKRDLNQLDIWHNYDVEREANGAQHVRQFLQQNGHEFRPHVAIALDRDGNPLDTPANRERFGPIRTVDNLSLEVGVANAAELARERESSIQGFVSTALHGVGGEGRAAARWVLPSSPGGIALRPALELPADLGTTQGITIDDRNVVLVTSKGRFAIPALHPQSFATVLRTFARGEIPFVTIGSEPSGRTGHLRVTYAPSLRGTREGALLYRADVQFKAIFLDYPFGADYQLNGPKDALVSGFPGSGGDFGRFWITSAGFRLKVENGQLVTATHGMRINSETRLRGEVVPDPTLEAYAERLSRNWDAIAEKLWEFRAVQDIALATALAFWVRSDHVPVSPLLWSLPPRYDYTPDFVPVAGAFDKRLRVSGGVALAPEEKGRESGRLFLFAVASALDRRDQANGSHVMNRVLFGGVAALVMLVALLLFALVPWVLARWSLRGRPKPRLRYRRMVWIALLAILSQGVLTVGAFCVNDWLGGFDQNFLAFVVTFMAGPLVLFAWLGRLETRRSELPQALREAPLARLGIFCWSLTLPVFSAVVGTALAVLTTTIGGVLPTPALERVLTMQLAPVETLANATTSAATDPARPGRMRLIPLPRSLPLAMLPPFRHKVQSGLGHGEQVQFDGPPDPTFPVKTLRRIHWPANMPVSRKISHYSADGRPPY
jgi:hypothetical protein